MPLDTVESVDVLQSVGPADRATEASITRRKVLLDVAARPDHFEAVRQASTLSALGLEQPRRRNTNRPIAEPAGLVEVGRGNVCCPRVVEGWNPLRLWTDHLAPVGSINWSCVRLPSSCTLRVIRPTSVFRNDDADVRRVRQARRDRRPAIARCRLRPLPQVDFGLFDSP